MHESNSRPRKALLDRMFGIVWKRCVEVIGKQNSEDNPDQENS